MGMFYQKEAPFISVTYVRNVPGFVPPLPSPMVLVKVLRDRSAGRLILRGATTTGPPPEPTAADALPHVHTVIQMTYFIVLSDGV